MAQLWRYGKKIHKIILMQSVAKKDYIMSRKMGRKNVRKLQSMPLWNWIPTSSPTIILSSALTL